MTIKRAERCCPNKKIKAELKYNSLTLSCHHGGKSYKEKCTTGQRPKQFTNKINCPFRIRVISTADGSELEIADIRSSHNHEISKEEFKFLPTQRKLSKTEEDEVANLIKLNADRKLIQKTYSSKTGKNVILKDIHNIASKAQSSLSDDDGVQGIADFIQREFPDLETEFVTEDNSLSGIFLQDKQMKNTFANFPEVLLADATHKTNQLELPLYALMCIDGNGASHVIAAFLIKKEDEVSIRKMIQIFKERNPRCSSIDVVVTDKDMTERTVFKSELPQVKLQICLFHVMRTFSREISCEKMAITTGEKNTILDKLQSLVYARNIEQYEDHYREFCDISPDTVQMYFNQNWANIKEQWVEGLKSEELNLYTRTNNRLESFFSKLKSTVTSRASIKNVISKLMGILSTLRNERQFKFVSMKYKVPTKALVQSNFHNHLTPYAYEHVQKQIEFAKSVKVIDENTVETATGQQYCTDVLCSCSFFKSMALPCKHIFAIRQFKGLEVYCPEIVHNRWTAQHTRTAFELPTVNSPQVKVSHQSTPQKRVLSENDKFKKTAELGQQLASVLSKCGTTVFHERINILKTVLDYWTDNKDCTVIELITENEVSSASSNSHLPDISSSTHNEELLVDDFVSLEEEIQSNLDEQHNSDAPSSNSESNLDAPSSSSQSLQMVTLPKKISKRGRPKGSQTTAIGLPKAKRARKGKPIRFMYKSMAQKQRHILGWFCEPECINSAFQGSIIDETQIESIPENVPSSCMDPQIDLNIIKRFLDSDAWMLLTQVYNSRLDQAWYCSSCQVELDNYPSIGCDSCLNWMHFKCVGIKTQPKQNYWFCKSCKELA